MREEAEHSREYISILKKINSLVGYDALRLYSHASGNGKLLPQSRYSAAEHAGAALEEAFGAGRAERFARELSDYISEEMEQGLLEWEKTTLNRASSLFQGDIGAGPYFEIMFSMRDFAEKIYSNYLRIHATLSLLEGAYNPESFYSEVLLSEEGKAKNILLERIADLKSERKNSPIRFYRDLEIAELDAVLRNLSHAKITALGLMGENNAPVPHKKKEEWSNGF